jgi:hypothetical protein
LIVIDDNYKEHLVRFFNATIKWFEMLLSSNATACSPKSQQSKAQKAPFAEKVVAKETGFVIASAMDNAPWSGSRTYRSQAEAIDALKAQAKSYPKVANDLHVIPSAEARAAA